MEQPRAAVREARPHELVVMEQHAVAHRRMRTLDLVDDVLRTEVQPLLDLVRAHGWALGLAALGVGVSGVRG